MYYDTLNRELTELIARCFSFNDIEAIGRDLFYTYSTHDLEGVLSEITISSLSAAARLVRECTIKKMIPQLISYLIQMEGNYLNGKIVNIYDLENLLYRLLEHGYSYDYATRKFVSSDKEKKQSSNWGALKDGKKYEIAIASIDICENSKLVRQYGVAPMERVYNLLHTFLRTIIHEHEGRIWRWAGDGGLMAFRGGSKIENSVRCAMAIQLTLPMFNLHSKTALKNDIIKLRIAIDCGLMRFSTDIGRIVSDTINYVAHLEKKGTDPSGLSISEIVYADLPKQLKRLFTYNNKEFEGRTAYSIRFDHDACFGLERSYTAESLQEAEPTDSWFTLRKRSKRK